VGDPTERPRPTPDGSARATAGQAADSVTATQAPVLVQRSAQAYGRTRPAPISRVEVRPSQVVAAAGTAVVTAARMGRLLGRSGWRIARQLPGGRLVEREAQRLQQAAAAEARRWLDGAGGEPTPRPGTVWIAPTPEEQRAADHVRTADPATAPLRSAMGELLERSIESSRASSRDYLYGTIISQLVPDEARILAALADRSSFAAADVVHKQWPGKARVLVANLSSVGRQAGLNSPENVPTYLTRLAGFGLVEFGAEDESLTVQYDILATDSTVQRARESADRAGRGTVRLDRKTVRMSPFGREFWAAADPSRPSPPS
jgi:hypothetical protein